MPSDFKIMTSSVPASKLSWLLKSDLLYRFGDYTLLDVEMWTLSICSKNRWMSSLISPCCQLCEIRNTHLVFILKFQRSGAIERLRGRRKSVLTKGIVLQPNKIKGKNVVSSSIKHIFLAPPERILKRDHYPSNRRKCSNLNIRKYCKLKK